MSKKRGRPKGGGKVGAVAENVGTALGRVMAKVDAWMSLRQEIARELRAVADQLTSGEGTLAGVFRGRRRAEAAAEPSDAVESIGRGRKAKKRTMSPEARAKIAEAQTEAMGSSGVLNGRTIRQHLAQQALLPDLAGVGSDEAAGGRLGNV